jgi:dynactin complex subunit
MENKQQKEFFEEILNMRQRIQELEKEIENTKLEEMKKFKRRYDSFKMSNTKQSVTLDLIHSALFGNSIVI